MTKYTVVLSSVGNPDFRQDPTKPLPGVPEQRVEIETAEAAAALCRQYIADHDLGGGNWSGGQIYADGRLIARVSYNGRVWNGPWQIVNDHAPFDVTMPIEELENTTLFPDVDGFIYTRQYKDALDEEPMRISRSEVLRMLTRHFRDAEMALDALQDMGEMSLQFDILAAKQKGGAV